MTYDLNTPALARLWPYEPDWSSPFKVTRSFLTDLLVPRSGIGFEQRRALRDVARLSLSYKTVLTDANLRTSGNWLRAAQNYPAVVPDFSRYVRLTGTTAALTDELTIASPPSWIAADKHLVLCGSDGLVLVVVAGVVGDTVTLTANVTAEWATGSVVRPGIFGLMAPQQRQTWFTPKAGEVEIKLAAYPGGEPDEDEDSETLDLFNGLEVLTIDPDWSQSPAMDWLFPVEQVDRGVGRTAQFRPVTRSQGLIESQYGGLTVAQATTLERLFLRCKGMRGAFYRSTCRHDMVLQANVTASALVTVTGPEIADDFGAVDYAEVGQAVEIIQTDGTRIRRNVTDIDASGGHSRLTLSSAVTLTTGTTARISWLPKVRFASDDLTSEWITPARANIRAAFQTIDR